MSYDRKDTKIWGLSDFVRNPSKFSFRKVFIKPKINTTITDNDVIEVMLDQNDPNNSKFIDMLDQKQI